MAEAQRREMLQLADAIRKCQADVTVSEESGSRLRLALEIACLGSKFVGTGDTLVEGAKAELCAACRGGSLFRCDVESGWSTKCAFMLANQC